MPHLQSKPSLLAALLSVLVLDGQSSGVAAEETLRVDRDLDWTQCSALPDPSTDLNPAATLTRISAGSAELERTEERVTLKDQVEITQGAQRLEADSVVYDRGGDEKGSLAEAIGNVFYSQPGLLASGSEARMELDLDTGQMKQVEYRIPDRHARGSADEAKLLDRNRTEFTNLTYTTCAPGDPGWLLKAGELSIDREKGVGTARDATLAFQGTPFLYTPWVEFPIDDRRMSGLLAPSIGMSSETGLDISIPYYFNIAPNMDATLSPRILSKRGLLLGGEFRFLTPGESGELRAELLPHDAEVPDQLDPLRGAFSFQGRGAPLQNWFWQTELNYVSDNQYMEDLNKSVAITSQRFLERRADLHYIDNGWHFLGRAQYFQTVDDLVTDEGRPYARMPQLLLDYDQYDRGLGLRYQLHSELVRFDRAGGVVGERVDLQPAVSLPWRRPWGFVTPRAGARYTGYRLDDQTAGWDDAPDRLLPTASLDSGLFFERDANWFGHAVTQTLEPRLFYLYTPYEDQNEIPLFDTAEYDFSFAQIFQENRFSGADRVGDANQMAAALTSRTLNPEDGSELFRASIGQVYYFRDREVQLHPDDPIEQGDSAVIGELGARLDDRWSTRAAIEWDPNKDREQTSRSALLLQYQDEPSGRRINLGYRMNRDLVEQTDISGRWPITGNLHAVGRWNYSLMDDQTLDLFGGIEYSSCCWGARLVARHYTTDADEEPRNAVYLQLELKGLTSIGNDVDTFLERNILGYTTGN